MYRYYILVTPIRKELFCNRSSHFFTLKQLIILVALAFCTSFSYSQHRISGSNYSDIAKIFLEIEKEINQDLNIENYLYKIDSFAETLNCEFENCLTIQDSLKIINENLFYKQQLFFKNECEFISNIVNQHCGNCASFSAYYLAIAGRLGVKNLYPVLAPTHVFLRYDYNGTKINIKTTQKGDNYSDQ